MKHFGERLEQRLKELRLTQADLARHLGVTKATISYWISDRNRPTFDRLEQIAAFLACSVGELMGEAPLNLRSVQSPHLRNVLRNVIATHDRVLRKEGSQEKFLTQLEELVELFGRKEESSVEDEA
jgi:transcriptional regulator with XRE-family HTH domain